MGKKNIRIHTLIEIIKNHNVGSQEELLKLLEKEGISVTQATLSRDLKMLKTSKVPLEQGEYAYMLPDALTIKKQGSPQKSELASHLGNGFISIEYTGNIGVMLTRNGYASGIAYDIDLLNAPEIAGTIAGANTVFIAFREGVTHDKASEILSQILPIGNIAQSH